MVKSRKSADADKRAANRRRGGEDDSYSLDDGGGASESGEEATATAPDLSLDALRKVFHLPCVDAAASLGVAHSKLKRRCHKLKIARWPQRKLASLVFLRDALPNDSRLSEAQREAIFARISTEYGKVMQDPNHPLDKELEQLRKSNYKLNYNRKLKFAAKSGKRAASVGEADAGPSGGLRGGGDVAVGGVDTTQWRGTSRSGHVVVADGGGFGGSGAVSAARHGGALPPTLSLGGGNGTSPAVSGQEDVCGFAAAAAAEDLTVLDTAAKDDMVVSSAAVTGLGSSPRKVVQRRRAVQLGSGGGSACASGHLGGLGRRGSLERAAMLSVIADGKIMKQGGLSRRQSGSGSGSATPRQLGSGSSPVLRRNLTSPVGHGGGAGGGGGGGAAIGGSREGVVDGKWAGQQLLTAEQMLEQPQQLPLQRPVGTSKGDEEWEQQCNPWDTFQDPGPVLSSHVLSDGASYGACGNGGWGLPSSVLGSGTAATAAATGGGGGGDGGGGSAVSAGVNAILSDTGGPGGLLMGLEAMVAGVSGVHPPISNGQLSEEELALLGIHGADRDLLLDATGDAGLDPLVDLLLAGGDAAAAAAGLGRSMTLSPLHRHHPHLQQHAAPSPFMINGAHTAAAAYQNQQQHLLTELDSQQRLLSSLGAHGALMNSHFHFLQQQQPTLQPLAGGALLPLRRVSDALPGSESLFGDLPGGGCGLSSLLRMSAPGLPLGASTGAVGGGMSHSSLIRQHRLSSMSGFASSGGLRPSRFAGVMDLPLSTPHPSDLDLQQGGGHMRASSNGVGDGAGLGAMSSHDRYSTDRAGRSGMTAQLSARYDTGDAGGGGDLGRRRAGVAANGLNQQPYEAHTQPHQHILSAAESRHSAPGQIGIPGWDNALARCAGTGGSGLDPNTLPMCRTAAGLVQPATALGNDLHCESGVHGGLVGLDSGGGGNGGTDRDLARRLTGTHVRATSVTGLTDPTREGFAFVGSSAAGSRAATVSGYDGGGAITAAMLFPPREQQLISRDHLTRAVQANGTSVGGYSGGYGGGGPAAAAAALGASGLHSQPPALKVSPTLPAAASQPAGRVIGGVTTGAVHTVGQPFSTPETILSLQGLRLREEEERLSIGDLPGGLVSGSGNDLAAMLQELHHLRRQQQQQILQAQELQRQQLDIARLGALRSLTSHSHLYGASGVVAAAAAGGKQLQLLGQAREQGLGSVGASTSTQRQQVQQLQHVFGGGASGLVSGQLSGLSEAVECHLSSTDPFMDRHVYMPHRNSSGFGSFVNEVRNVSSSGLGGGSAGNFGFAATCTGACASNAAGVSAGADMELMRQNLRRDLRQNSAEQWEEMLRQLAASGSGVGGTGM